MNESVESPNHYSSPTGVECVDVIYPMPYALASAVKYVWRYDEKGTPVEDLKKALYCLKLLLVDQARSMVFSNQLRDLHTHEIAYSMLLKHIDLMDSGNSKIPFLNNLAKLFTEEYPENYTIITIVSQLVCNVTKLIEMEIED